MGFVFLSSSGNEPDITHLSGPLSLLCLSSLFVFPASLCSSSSRIHCHARSSFSLVVLFCPSLCRPFIPSYHLLWSFHLPDFLSSKFASSFIFWTFSISPFCLFSKLQHVLPSCPPPLSPSVFCPVLSLLSYQSPDLLLSIILSWTILLLHLSLKQPHSPTKLFIRGSFKCSEPSMKWKCSKLSFF